MRTKTGIKFKDDWNIPCTVEIEQYDAIYPYAHKVTKVWGIPQKNDRYYELKRKYGDDWVNDITNNWFEMGVMELSKQEKLQRILDDIR